ncbi:hypothetical protein DPMN_047153 [Dreissena polymorpha]|uniref:Agenet domain-containing protein n=1 Tax=Dreissena polymorpha TaxID=45954 RepID=A0A9D4D873_DREPO|nr:hypothetical protein DPMN_047153 [Dreissena polymorpha]
MYETSADDLKTRNKNIKAVKGTFKLHAVVPIGNTSIATRELSCPCTGFKSDMVNSECGGWTVHELLKTKSKSDQKVKGALKAAATKTPPEEDSNSPQNVDKDVNTDESEKKSIHVEEGDVCAAVFEQEWYIGRVSEIDKSEDRVKINFMEEIGTRETSFRWPTKADIAWIPVQDMLMKVPEPHASGSRKRLYKLGNEITDLLEELCERNVSAS